MKYTKLIPGWLVALAVAAGVSRVSVADPTVIYVNAAAPLGGSGESWATAFRDLQSAIDLAQTTAEASEIWIANGNYSATRESTAGDVRSKQWVLSNTQPLSIIGGFTGSEESKADRPLPLQRSVLDGVGNYNVIKVSGVGAVSLDRLDIRNGSWEPGVGAGVWVFSAASVTITECDIHHNAAYLGAAIYCHQSSPIVIRRTIIRDNDYTLNGRNYVVMLPAGNGAIMDNCLIFRNTSGVAYMPPDGSVPFLAPQIVNCTIASNGALNPDSALWIYSAGAVDEVLVINSVIWGNGQTQSQSQQFGLGRGFDFDSCLIQGWDGTGATGTGTTAQDPLFTNSAGGNFSLSNGSPGIDTGLNAYASAADLIGNHRVVDGNGDSNLVVDRGCIEFGSSTLPVRGYVWESLNTGANNGTSWQNAFRGANAFQNALAFASSNSPYVQEIWVAAGTYKPSPRLNMGGSRSASFNLQNNLAIYGGFTGNETTLSQRDIEANLTILSGDLHSDDNSDPLRADNSVHVVFAQSVDESAMLDGFIIEHGNAESDGGGGGGARLDSASPQFVNCKFRQNWAGFGGGVSIAGGQPRFAACIFERNNNSAFFLSTSNTIFADCRFIENHSEGGAGAGGANGLSTPQFIRCLFVRNDALGVGGVFHCNGIIGTVTPVFANCKFYGNSAYSTSGSAGAAGGAIWSYLCDVRLYGCEFIGNRAMNSSQGSAIAVFSNSVHAINCDFVVNHSAGQNASAFWVEGVSTLLHNSILWGNTGGSARSYATQLGYPAGSLNATHNIVEFQPIDNFNNIPNDPLFLRAPSPGADGVWDSVGDDYGDLRLTNASPGIDSGNSAAVPPDSLDIDADGNTTEALPLDILGNLRFVDAPLVTNTGIGSPPVDRGAYEYVPPTCIPTGERLWVAPTGGNFNTDFSWFPCVPTTQSDVRFDIPSTFPVIFPAANISAKSAIIRRGDVTFSFANSSWNLTAATNPALQIGDTLPSLASLTVTGGTLQAFSALIGTNAGSQGHLRVTGAGSTVNIPNDMSIGFFGRGTALIDNGGRLITRTAGVGDQPGSEGSYVQVTGAGSRWDVPFFLQINNGEVNVSSGATLNAGFGIFLFQGGTLSGDGTINGDVVNFGALRPGNSPGILTINGDYEQVGILPDLGASSGRLIAEVAGTPASGNYDKLIVNGTATVGGLLQVNLANGYVPAPTDSFQLVRATGSVQSLFDVAYFPGLNNQRFLNVAYVSGPNGLGTIELKNSPLVDGSDFGDNRPFGVNGGPTAIAVGDLNGDTFPDLAVTVPDTLDPTGQNGFVHLLINDGGAGQNWNGFRASMQIPVGRNPVDLVLTDLDNDPAHRLDIAVVNRSSGSVTIFRNDGTDGNQDPILANAMTLTGFSDPRGIAAGNLDRNFPSNPAERQYRRDLAVTNFASGTITTFSNTSTAGNLLLSSGSNLSVGNGPRRIIIADIDNDKDLPTTIRQQSIFVLRPGESTLSVLHRNQDAEGFVQSDYLVGTDPVDIVVGHLRNLALPSDIAVVNQGSDSISILVNRGGGEFSPPANLSVGSAPSAIVATNVDGDDDLDLAFCSGAPGFREVQLLRNDISGPQLAFVLLNGQVTSGTSPKFIAAANVDNDAQQGNDLVTIDGTGARAFDNIKVIRNRLTDIICPPDFNHDAAVDFFDYLDFVDAFSAEDPSADFNNDTSIDFFDYLDFVDAFSIGC